MLTAGGYAVCVFTRLNAYLNAVLAEIRNHADPSRHETVHITPVESLGGRLGLLALIMGGLIMIPIAAAVPMLPIWPFAIIVIVCMARLSARFRRWLTANRAFNTMMSIVRTRPERIFRWADRLMRHALGERRDSAVPS
jgi:hypothetical protein